MDNVRVACNMLPAAIPALAPAAGVRRLQQDIFHLHQRMVDTLGVHPKTGACPWLWLCRHVYNMHQALFRITIAEPIADALSAGQLVTALAKAFWIVEDKAVTAARLGRSLADISSRSTEWWGERQMKVVAPAARVRTF